ncbi:hypothetical protein [Pseudohaliea sp.]|uniref:hypothetical protein n=1 Tax=Pseudohaliea sp. TaxID=2740289 RepID=UPI0032EAE959
MSRRRRTREDRLEAGAGQPAPRNLWLRRDLLEKMEKGTAPADIPRRVSPTRAAAAPEDAPRPHAEPRRVWR